MIDERILILMGAVLAAMICRDWALERRRSRRRNDLRHVIGARQWWGRR